MFKLRIRTGLVLGLLVLLLASVAIPVSAMPYPPRGITGPSAPTVNATLHHSGPATLGTYELRVTGKGFVPGERVQLALIDTTSLRVIHRGSAVAVPEVNPLAGTIDYRASFISARLAAPAHLWLESTRHMDIHNVRTQ